MCNQKLKNPGCIHDASRYFEKKLSLTQRPKGVLWVLEGRLHSGRHRAHLLHWQLVNLFRSQLFVCAFESSLV